jgi:hypothetical protein
MKFGLNLKKILMKLIKRNKMKINSNKIKKNIKKNVKVFSVTNFFQIKLNFVNLVIKLLIPKNQKHKNASILIFANKNLNLEKDFIY